MDDVVTIDRAGETVLIPGSTGTPIGDMTGQGGLAAGFDGGLTEAYPGGMAADLGADGDATIGKNWGAGITKTITRYRVSFQGTGGSPPYNSGAVTLATLTLEGSADGAAWTVLHTYGSAIAGDAGSLIDVTSGITTTTAYQYHRVHMVSSSGAVNTYVAEVEFYEDV